MGLRNKNIPCRFHFFVRSYTFKLILKLCFIMLVLVWLIWWETEKIVVAPFKIWHKFSLENWLLEKVNKILISLYDNYLLSGTRRVHQSLTISTSLRKYARNMAVKCTTDGGLLELFKRHVSVASTDDHRSCKWMFI